VLNRMLYMASKSDRPIVKNKSLSLKVSQELHARVLVIAERSERSMNWLCERYIERGVAGDEKIHGIKKRNGH